MGKRHLVVSVILIPALAVLAIWLFVNDELAAGMMTVGMAVIAALLLSLQDWH